MAVVSGTVEHIVYRNPDNGYTVMEVTCKSGSFTLVGTIPHIDEGEPIEAEGSFVTHPVYGEQLAVTSYEIGMPQDLVAIERYLGSGAISGIGPALAGRIVKKFKLDTLRVLEEEPELLAKVKGISETGAQKIAAQVLEKRELRSAMIFLQQYGISLQLAVKIYDHYGPELYNIVRTNPYRMVEDIPGVGFRTADAIAQKAGLCADSEFRVRSGLYYTMLQAAASGHVCLPREVLLENAAMLLQVPAEELERFVMELAVDKRLTLREQKGRTMVYSTMYYHMELAIAVMLGALCVRYPDDEEERFFETIDDIEKRRRLWLNEEQRRAVHMAAFGGLSIITGGPGTGKTTIINILLDYFEQQGLTPELAAPTGRAAKRMTEATGRPARTIHRLLEFSGIPERDSSGDSIRFARNESNPIEADVIIVDEMSMVDIHLMYALLKAVIPGTHLVLVGDANQLPSVGPGNILRDMLEAGCFPGVCLRQIFRQEAQSDIVVNAHKIHAGEVIDAGKRSRDFLFVKRFRADAILQAVVALVKEKLPEYVGAEQTDIQVMTPMRKGVLGVENLNRILQQSLNPPADDKTEKQFARFLLRQGDKVMQIRNNYKIPWEVLGKYGIPGETGEGIFNGDIGFVADINLFSEEIEVIFDDEKLVRYRFADIEELELAYAITVHKSQGSEYPAVVIPLLTGPRPLMNRNLIYTAVTRAKSCVCIVGPPESFQAMVDNAEEQKRYSGLDVRLSENCLLQTEEACAWER